jgi:hypothetical protein
MFQVLGRYVERLGAGCAAASRIADARPTTAARRDDEVTGGGCSLTISLFFLKFFFRII